MNKLLLIFIFLTGIFYSLLLPMRENYILKISGTSSLRGWDMTSYTVTEKAIMEIADDTTKDINSLNIIFPKPYFIPSTLVELKDTTKKPY